MTLTKAQFLKHDSPFTGQGVAQRGGKTYHGWEGGIPETFLQRGLYGMFSPLLSFPPPLPLVDSTLANSSPLNQRIGSSALH